MTRNELISDCFAKNEKFAAKGTNKVHTKLVLDPIQYWSKSIFPNKKAMTSDVYFDPSNICFQMITFKKKTVLRTYVKIVLNKYFLYQKY